VKTRVKNVIKEVRLVVAENNKEQAEQILRTATSVIDKAAKKGVLHWKNAARKVSKLRKLVNSLG
jgi:small subunit ribosomal protein S20